MGNLAWGLQITVLGMGLVFALLGLLWGLLTLVRTLDREAAAPLGARESDTGNNAPITDNAEGAQPSRVAMKNDIPPERVAAIVIAVHKHREVLQRMAQSPEPARSVSPWLAAGRVQQNTQWQARGR